MKATAQMGGLTLLPCPFCGSLSGLHEDRNIFPEGPGWRVECEGACHAMTCYWHIATDAVAHWNLRQSLSLESVRSEARLDQGDKFMQAKLSGFNEGLEEAAKVCARECMKYSTGGAGSAACRGALRYAEDAILALKGKGASQGDESIAAPQAGRDGTTAPSHEGHAAGPAVAAPTQVIVPREPTRDMVWAGSVEGRWTADEIRDIWRAMLAASPDEQKG